MDGARQQGENPGGGFPLRLGLDLNAASQNDLGYAQQFNNDQNIFAPHNMIPTQNQPFMPSQQQQQQQFAQQQFALQQLSQRQQQPQALAFGPQLGPQQMAQAMQLAPILQQLMGGSMAGLPSATQPAMQQQGMQPSAQAGGGKRSRARGGSGGRSGGTSHCISWYQPRLRGTPPDVPCGIPGLIL